MKVRTQVVLVLAMIAALLAATASATGAQERPERPIKDPASETPIEEVLPGEEPLIPLTDTEVDRLIKTEMDAWLIVRDNMGFTGDAEEIADLVRSREGQLGRDAWSVPLTYAERAEMDERTRATSNSGRARAALEEMDGYADMYIDHQENGTIFVNFARDLTRQEQHQVAALFEIPDRVETRQVKHSLKELQAIADEINRLRGKELSEVTTVAIGAQSNAVIVGVSEDGVTTPANPKASAGFVDQAKGRIATALTAASLDAVIEMEIVPVGESEGCWGRLNCGTSGENWRGGTGLDTNRSGSFISSSCTTGFIFTNGAQRLLSTSGHCDIHANRDVAIAGQNHSGGSFDEFTMNSVITDWPLVNATDFNATVESDAAMILINPSRSDNRVYKSYQKKNWYINDRDDSVMENDMTCISGTSFGFRCGTVRPLPTGAFTANGKTTINTNYSYTVNSWIRWNWIFPGVISSGGGNSGSPMFSWRTAQGLHFAGMSYTPLPGNSSTSVESAFTPISAIEAELGVTLCTSAANC